MIYTFGMNHKQESLNLIKIQNTLTTSLLPRLDGRVFLADDVTASCPAFRALPDKLFPRFSFSATV
jgi:hypothetical protein